MTDKERLEEIKKRFTAMNELESFKKLAPTDLFFDDIEWLIQQAERVQELEGRLKVSEANNDILKHEVEESEEQSERVQDLKIMLKVLGRQTERYKQALEFYATEDNYITFDSPAIQDYGKIARNVLEGKE